jgi:flagellar protein FlaI
MNIPKPLVGMTNVVMVMSRTEVDGRPARRVNTTTEVLGYDTEKGNIKTEEISAWNPKFDKFSPLKKSVLVERHIAKLGISEEDVKRELYRRQTVLDWMAREGIRRHTEVANVIREYYANSERVFQKARLGIR